MIKKFFTHMIGSSNEIALLQLRRFKKYSFKGTKGKDYYQYEAIIIRLYHTIEKGLAYTNFRPGFGTKNIAALIEAMENYISDGYNEDSFFYRTALSTLKNYIKKNRQYNNTNPLLEEKIAALKGISNELGGDLVISPLSEEEVQMLSYKNFVLNRHSIRHFSKEPVSLQKVQKALEIAQHTPSACNRQGWHSVVISDKSLIKRVLKNQNGNEGFGHEFDKLILIVSDIRYFNADREVFQAYVDGGMYAQSVLNALHYEHIASVPLSAALSTIQEENIRELLKLSDSELLIMFIGIGNYPDECRTTMSTRKVPRNVYY